MKQLPTKEQLLEWMRENPGQSSKREIARAFGLRGDDRIELKRLLGELKADGQVETRRRKIHAAGVLPPVAVLQITGQDRDGDQIAEPTAWDGDDTAPKILIVPKKGDPGLSIGDRILAKITETADEHVRYEARLIRKIGTGPARVLGIFRQADYGGRIIPVDKKADKEWMVAPGDRNGARDDELVEGVSQGPRSKMGLPRARIVERLGDPTAPKSVFLIAVHEHGIPDIFPDSATEEAKRAKPITLEDREDLRELPLITIDPADARDHDDAVCALPDDDPKNAGGFVVWVAIADVAHYVRPGSALDREARHRGNSTYFPDRVVPMLPEALSGDLCSLHEGLDRPCVAVRMVLNAAGEKIGHRFVRGLMRSPASLNYVQVQAAIDGSPDETCEPLLEPVLKPLFAAWNAAMKAQRNRQPLHLDIPERRIELSDAGEVLSVAFRDRLDAHKVIEEFMILANVAAAETLEAKRTPLLYRVHEEPDPDKIDALREQLETTGITLAKGQVLKTALFNRVLDQAAGTEFSEQVSMSVLRSMPQAYYSHENYGHFGLNLKRYAHFTSPIRRYSDLIVHRALIKAHGWGEDGLSTSEIDELEATAEHISQTERRSMMAERDTTDRYLAAFLSERVGNEFSGKVSGIARFGLFVKLDDTGADGLVPISMLGHEYFHFDAGSQTLTGEKSRKVIGLGMTATVRLAEAVPVTGGLLFELLEIGGNRLPTPKAGGKGSGGRSRSRSKIKGRKTTKAAKRRR